MPIENRLKHFKVLYVRKKGYINHISPFVLLFNFLDFELLKLKKKKDSRDNNIIFY